MDNLAWAPWVKEHRDLKETCRGPRGITAWPFAAATATGGFPLLRPFKIWPRPAVSLASGRPRLQPLPSGAAPGSHVLLKARAGPRGRLGAETVVLDL